MNSSFRRVVPALAALALVASPAAYAESAGAQVQLPSLAPLVDSVKSAVVNVEVKSRSTEGEGDEEGPGEGDEGPPDDFFHFFGGQPRQPHQIREGLGSGFIVDSRGYILTNNHVVSGAIDIEVHFPDGRTFPAEVLGRDPLTDVALIKIKGEVPKNLPALKLGDSDAMKVGDWVLAIGNPFGLASSVSLGIISARAREIGATRYEDFLQTDAAINPGNSGGPLFNLKGEVIGINTAIVSGGSGIGFAVPSNLAKAIMTQLEKFGSVTRGFLGVGIQNLTPELARALGVPVPHGAVVSTVSPNTPAEKAGIRPDDVIVSLNGRPVESDTDLSRRVSLDAPGTVDSLGVYRNGKQMKVDVKLTTRPDLEHLRERERMGQGPEDRSNKQRIGLTFQDVDPRLAQALGVQARGALITDVVPGSPADHADLARGMVVIEANHHRVRDARELSRVIKQAKSGSTVLLRVEVPHGNASLLRALTIP